MPPFTTVDDEINSLNAVLPKPVSAVPSKSSYSSVDDEIAALNASVSQPRTPITAPGSDTALPGGSGVPDATDATDANAAVPPRRRSVFDVSPPAQPVDALSAPSRGVVTDVMSAIPRAAVRAVGMGARALRHGEAPEEAPTLTKVSDWAERTEKETPFLQPSQEMETSAFRRAIVEPVENVVQSVVASAPAAVAGTAIGGPVGGVLGFAAGAGTVFGAEKYDQVIQDARKQGLIESLNQQGIDGEALVRDTALKTALIEGGVEAAADLALAKLSRVIPGGLTAKSAVKDTIRQIFKTPVKTLAATAAKSAVLESATEALQGGWEASLEKRAGLKREDDAGNLYEIDPTGEALGSIVPAAGAGILFSILGQGMSAAQKRGMIKRLYGAKATPEARLKTAEEVAGIIAREQKNPQMAQNWYNSAVENINKGEPISVDELLSGYDQAKTEPAQAVPGAVSQPPSGGVAEPTPIGSAVPPVHDINIFTGQPTNPQMQALRETIAERMRESEKGGENAEIVTSPVPLEAQQAYSSDQGYTPYREVSALPEDPLAAAIDQTAREKQAVASLVEEYGWTPEIKRIEAVVNRRNELRQSPVGAEHLKKQLTEQEKAGKIAELDAEVNDLLNQLAGKPGKSQITEPKAAIPQETPPAIPPVAAVKPGEAQPVSAIPGQNVPVAAGKAITAALPELDRQAHEAATSPINALPQPSESQKEAGNYQKGHLDVQGLDISIENPKGSTRSGVSPEGKRWTSTLQNHYGYIKGTIGKDKDHIDAFIGPNTDSQKVYVVDQVNPKTGVFDEHKVMLGFNTAAEAGRAYHANYEKGWKGAGAITEMAMPAFKAWLASGKTKQAVALGKSEVVPRGTQQPVEHRLDDRLRDEFKKLIGEGRDEEAFDLAYKDTLTGLYNKNGWERLKATGDVEHMPVAMADLAGFKYLNDTYGHDFGDTVLQAYAKALKSEDAHVKSFRPGGDEAAAVAIDGNNEALRQSMERAKDILAATEFNAKNLKTGVQTVIKGVTLEYGIDTGPTAADKALYAERERLTREGKRSTERGGRPVGLTEKAESVAPHGLPGAPAQAEKITDTVSPAPVKPAGQMQSYAPGQSVRVGRSPQVHTIVEEMPASAAEKELGERYFRVKNDKTGETDVHEIKDLALVKKAGETTADPEGKKQAVTQTLKSFIDSGNTSISQDQLKSLYEVKKGQMTADQAQKAFDRMLAEKKAAEKETPKGKQPWEMTYKEFSALPQVKRAVKRFPHKTAEQVHRDYVQRALSEGDTVPQEVLDEYPDLQKETPKTPERILNPHEEVAKAKEIQAREPLSEQTITDGKVKTITGREIPAPPAVEGDTDRKIKRSMQRSEYWLMGQALEEAKSRKDDYNETWIKQLKPGKFTQADKDMVNVYLFNTENPQFIKEKAGTKTETKPAAKEGEWPQPNKHGVYDNDLAEKVEYKGKKASASIYALQVGPDEWVNGLDYAHKTGTMDGMGSPLSGEPSFKTKEEALKSAAAIIAERNEQLIKRSDSSDTMKAEARNIVMWAAKIAGITETAARYTVKRNKKDGGYGIIDATTGKEVVSFGSESAANDRAAYLNKIDKEEGTQNAEKVRSDEERVRKGSEERQPGVQPGAGEGGENLQQPEKTGTETGNAKQQVAPEALTVSDIPADLEITTRAVHEKTGKTYKLKENARTAFTRVQSEIDAFEEVQKCLAA